MVTSGSSSRYLEHFVGIRPEFSGPVFVQTIQKKSDIFVHSEKNNRKYKYIIDFYKDTL